MGVEITQDELNIFVKNGISENDIKDTVEAYRAEGVSDKDIKAKFDVKLNSFQNQIQSHELIQNQNNNIKEQQNLETPQNTTQTAEQNEPIVLREGVLTGGVSQNIRTYLDKKGRIHYINEDETPKMNWFKRQGRNIKARLTNLGSYINSTNEQDLNSKRGNVLSALSFLIPAGLGAKITGGLTSPVLQRVASWGLGGAAGGAVEGVAENLREGEFKPSVILASTGLGAAGGAALGGITAKTPALINGIKQRLTKKAKQKLVNSVEDVTENSVIENLLKQSDISVGAKIPQNAEIKGFDKPDVFYNDITAKEKQKEIINDIIGLKNPEMKKNYITRAKQGHFWRANIDDPYTRATQDADEEFNSIIKEIKKNPSVLNDMQKTQDFETRLDKKLSNLEPEHAEEYWTKFYQAFDKAGEYEKVGEDLVKANNMRISGELKRSKLPQSADLPKDVSKIANAPENAAEYEVLHNSDLIAQSQQMVNSNPDVLKSDLLKRAGEKDTNFEALDFENARQLVTKMLNEGKTEEALDLIESVANKGSKAGQAVQAMSLWSLQTPEGAILQGQKIINKFNKNVKNPEKKIPNLTEEQAKTLADLANDIIKQTDDRARDVATAKLLKYQASLVPVSGWQKAKTLRNISLLLNPKTLMRNVVGNGLFAGVESGSKVLASGIDNLLSNYTGKRARVIPQVSEAIKGAIRGRKEGFEDAMLGIDTRAGIGGRFDLPAQRSFKDPILGSLETALDVGLRVPDRIFFQGVIDESIANQLKAQGLKEVTPEIIEQARQEALESVFQNDSLISKGILGARKALNNIAISKEFGLGDLIIPYAQTPANIIQQGINYSPFGAIKAGVNLAKGNQRQGSLDLARSLVGSGIMAGGYTGANSGVLNGDIEDYKLRKNLETINERPFQITLPNGSKMSYSQLQPVSIPLSVGTALAQDDKEKAAQAALGTLLDLPMLDTLGRAVSDTQNYGIGTAAVNMAMGFPTQFVPTAVNQLNSFVDPYQRETFDSNPIMRGINQARNKMPFISKTLPKKYDVAGQPVKRYQSEGITKIYDAFVNPVFINKPKDDIVMQEVAALTKETGENGGLLNIPERKIKLDDGTTKKLNNKEFSEYSKCLGELTYKGYKEIMQTKRYINADDSTRLKLLGDIKTNAKAIVQEEMFGKANKHSSWNKTNRKISNRINRGQNKIERLFTKMDNQLIDNIMYKE